MGAEPKTAWLLRPSQTGKVSYSYFSLLPEGSNVGPASLAGSNTTSGKKKPCSFS